MTEIWLTKDVLQKSEERARRFIAETEKGQRQLYAFGRNIYSQGIADALALDGFIDDFANESLWHELPVLQLKDTPKGSLVIVCSGGNTQTALAKVQCAGHECIDYFSFLKYSKHSGLPDIVFNKGFAGEYTLNHTEYQKILDRLADDQSKTILRKLLDFRLNYALEALNGFEDNQRNQYFEPFLDFGVQPQTFADVGGYDGATALEFAKRFPNYKRILVFEPDPKNLIKCTNTLEQLTNCTIFPFGLSSKSTTLKFSSDGSASKANANGDVTISVRPLDEVVQDDVITFLKMDIEGGELDALAGAKHTIAKHKPKMAISVYHKPGDFWRIPKYVLSINPSYKIYLRHYTETIYETVMFFV